MPMLSLTPSPKSCQKCGKGFLPKNTMQIVCSLRCAAALARQMRVEGEKEGRSQTRARKEAIKTLPELHREAQAEFNKWVRARDADQPCVSCGTPPPDLSQLHAGRDAGHYRSIGAAAHLRYHEDNCHAQCVKCNQYKAGNAVDYRIRLIDRIGLARVEALEADNEPRKWTRDDIRAIRDTYRIKAKELLKQREEMTA